MLTPEAANSRSMRGKTGARLLAERLKFDRDILSRKKWAGNDSHFVALSISSPEFFSGWSFAPVLARELAAKASVAGAR